MTPEQFAKKAGCVVSINEDPGWNGKYQYHSVDHPNCHFCGYKTEAAAYRAFMKDTYGPTAAKAVMALLKKVSKT